MPDQGADSEHIGGTEPEPEHGPEQEPEPEHGPEQEPEPEHGPEQEPEPEHGPEQEPGTEPTDGSEPEPTGGGGKPAPSFLPARMAAALLIGGGLFLLYNAFEIEPPRGFSVIDPNFFPIFVSLGIFGLGVILLLRTTLVPDWDLAHTTAEEGLATHWPTVFLVLGTLVLYAFALAPAGYIVATAVFVPVVAHWMGSKSPLRDATVGLIFAVVIYVFFTEILGIRLPAGILDVVL